MTTSASGAAGARGIKQPSAADCDPGPGQGAKKARKENKGKRILFRPHPDIFSTDKKPELDAIKNIAKSLNDKGLVESDYVSGMLNREKQNSTFLFEFSFSRK